MGPFGVAALFVGVGVTLSRADEPKPPKPQNTQPGQQPSFAVPGELGKTQEQLQRAMESLAKDPNDPAACQTASRFSRVVLWSSAGLYMVGCFTANILGPLLVYFDL